LIWEDKFRCILGPRVAGLHKPISFNKANINKFWYTQNNKNTPYEFNKNVNTKIRNLSLLDRFIILALAWLLQVPSSFAVSCDRTAGGTLWGVGAHGSKEHATATVAPPLKYAHPHVGEY